MRQLALRFVSTHLLALVWCTSGFAQCGTYCDDDWFFGPTSWTTGVEGGSFTQDCVVSNTSGQFPAAVSAHINFSKEPQSGNGCKFHSGGGTQNNPWMRWAQVQLNSCVNFGIRVDYDLGTFDHWVPSSPSNSDVFFLAAGKAPGSNQPFSNVGSLGAVSCGNAPQYSASIANFDGEVYWWGNDVLSCSGTCNQTSTIEPCTMTGSRVFDFRQGIDFAPYLRVGLSTGWCIWTYGTFDIKILPLKIDIVDPIGYYVTNGNVVNDAEGLSTHDVLRKGVVADGATQVVLRHEVLGPGQVQFQVDDQNGGPSTADDVGYFSSLGGQEHATSLTVDVVSVSGGRYVALAVYHAPADFITAPQYFIQGCREARVRAEYQPQAGNNVQGSTMTTRYLQVLRPPVILTHGIWSDKSTWGANLSSAQTFITDPNFQVFLCDYKGTNDQSFFTNRKVTRDAIRDAIKKLHTQQYAVTRVDVVAHSMGGVLARLYALGYGGVTYKRNDNFNQGDIHKLITIDSPLKGSVLATFLMGSPPFRRSLAATGKSCTNGAVSDLDPFRLPPATNPNTWANSQPTDVYAHAIVGTGGVTALASPLSAGDDKWLALLEKTYGIGVAFVGPHDLIVDQYSQVGNIGNASPYGYLNSGQPGTHDTIHHDARVRARVLDLLNTNILLQGSFTPTIPARGNSNNPPVVPQHTPVKGLEMTFPTPSSVFSSGGTIPVTLTPINGFQPESMLVICPYDIVEVDPILLQATLQIPNSAIGPMSLYAFALDANSDIAETEDVVVQIVPQANLTGISVDPESIELTQDGPTESLYVTGHYDDATDRDLTNGALGTTYQSDNNNVATVSSNGLVTSVGFGSCTITVSNGSFNATAHVEVTGVPCPGDVTENGVVDIDDLLLVITSWGPCYGCPADITGNGVVDIDDLLAVVGHWGPCPTPQPASSYDPNLGCIDAIKWANYLEVLKSGEPEQVQCWNCWAYWHLCVCAGQCPRTLPDCGCSDPF